MTAISPISMTPDVMASRLGPRSTHALALGRGRRGMYGHGPDLFGVFADGAVGGEPGHPRHVEDAGPRPGRHHLPARVDAALRLVIRIEVGAHHVVVEMAQGMRDGLEPSRFVRGEVARFDGVDGAGKP